MDWKFEKNMYPILDTRVTLWSDGDTYIVLILQRHYNEYFSFMIQYNLLK